MGSLKIKAPKLNWRGKLLKLQKIVLGAAPLIEADPKIVKWIDISRQIARGKISGGIDDHAILPSATEMAVVNQTWLWEPYSDERGNAEKLFGWDFAATFYCADGKPWWLVRAAHSHDEPSEQARTNIESAVDAFGGHPTLDRIMNVSFGKGRGYAMWWTWINQLPLLEIQVRRTPPDMRIVLEGSPLPPGYERTQRATIKTSAASG